MSAEPIADQETRAPAPWIILGAALLAAVPAFWVAIGGWQDADFFWHGRIGRDWLEHGLWPAADHYSIGFQGVRYRTVSAGFDALLGAAELSLGELRGGQALSFALRAIPLGLLAADLVRRRASAWLALPALAIFTWAICLRGFIRPELCAPVFGYLMMRSFVRNREAWNPRSVLGMNLLLLAWVNTHSTSVFGFAILGALYAERLLQLAASRPARPADFGRAGAWSAATALLGFANLSGIHPIAFALGADPEWSRYIVEHVENSFFAQEPSHFVAWILAALTGLSLLARRRLGSFALVASLAYESYHLHKVLPYLVVLATPLAIAEAEQWRRRRLWESFRPSVQLALRGATLLVVLAVAWDLSLFVPRGRLTEADLERDYPEAVLRYARSKGVTGPVLNSHSIGGYLLGRGDPGLRVYIDGRTNMLYPIEHMRRLLEIEASSAELAREAERLSIRHAIVFAFGPRSQMMEAAALGGGFEVEYAANGYALLARSATAFPAASKLLARPECWDERQLPRLRAELAEARRLFPGGSDLNRLLELVDAYAAAAPASRAAFLEARLPALERQDRLLQLGAVWSLRVRRGDLASRYLEALRSLRTDDYLNLAEARALAGRPADAALVLRDLLRRSALRGPAGTGLERKRFAEVAAALPDPELQDWARRLGADPAIPPGSDPCAPRP